MKIIMTSARSAEETTVIDAYGLVSAAISILTDHIPTAEKNTLHAARTILGAAIGTLSRARRSHD